MVGKWVRTHYGLRSAVTAVFMLHAVVNMNPMVRVVDQLGVRPFIDHFTHRLFNLTCRMVLTTSQVNLACLSLSNISSYWLI